MPPSKSASRSEAGSASEAQSVKTRGRKIALGIEDEHSLTTPHQASTVMDANKIQRRGRSRSRSVRAGASPDPLPRRRSISRGKESAKPLRQPSVRVAASSLAPLARPGHHHVQDPGPPCPTPRPAMSPGAPGLFSPSDGEEVPVEDCGLGGGAGSDGHNLPEVPTGRPMDLTERWNMGVLVLLYMIQGIPLGLTTGAMPFMLQAKLTYTQVGVFSMAATPYSLKLLWSPIVDSCFSARLGRRKSWILPVQLATAAVLILCSGHIQRLYEAADVSALTSLFTVVVFLAATQDIAVDGWALTLLSPENVAYASTCQTVGTTLGYFTSFTIFLALNNGQFCDSYLRAFVPALLGAPGQQLPLVTLTGYLQFWGWIFVLVTAGIALFQPEKNFTDEEERERERKNNTEDSHAARQIGAADVEVAYPPPPRPTAAAASGRRKAKAATAPPSSSAPGTLIDTSAVRGVVGGGPLGDIAAAYRQLLGVVRLPAVWGLSAFLLSYRLGFMSAEGAYSLKLIDKGVSKEALAFLVLFQFPVELLSALLAGRWASRSSPYAPFITGYLLRILVSAALLVITAAFPPGAASLSEHAGPFGALAVVSLVGSFASTLTFTALGSLFNRVSDPSMGGAYLTLLNTIANMGYMLPRAPLFLLIDKLTVTKCTSSDGLSLLSDLASSCPKKAKDMAAPSACTQAGGMCALDSDGFYLVSWACLAMGVALGAAYLRLLPALMHLPLSRWRVTRKPQL